ncbi:unnamed protein product, partial [marine sediment metagenome]
TNKMMATHINIFIKIKRTFFFFGVKFKNIYLNL